MRVADFDFTLPEELIAQTPPAVRGSSRMLVLDRGSGRILADDVFSALPGYLRAGDLLVLNDSRVLPARLFGTRAGLTTQYNSPAPTGRIEVLLIHPLRTTHGESAPGDSALWSALVRPARKVEPGETLHFNDAAGSQVLTAEVVAAGEYGERTLRFTPAADFLTRLDQVGQMPLPPYIRRQDPRPEDRERYQTVYSQAPGSAAAPTAGLHFTPQILAALAAHGVETAHITLHVGLGTFQPVRVDHLDQIRLHTELYTLAEPAAAALNRARRDGHRIIAVGTTTTRTLEHCAATAAGDLEPHSGSTAIFLRPGHRFRMVNGLLTNFHLPQSTLLMLVSAFLAGSGPDDGRLRALAAYAHAVEQRYRFFSYGDCMLIL